MIIEQDVEVKWHGHTRKHYEDLGYKFTKKDDVFTVKSTELSRGSNIVVQYTCDYCGVIGEKKYGNIMNNRVNINKDCCKECAPKKHLESKLISGSLESKYPEVTKQWNTLKNKRAPSIVTPYSKIKAHWVCGKGHEWEARVYSRTSGVMTGCPVCAESKGERLVADVLDSCEVDYAREYHFDGLYGLRGGPLRFDFVIFDTDGEVTKAIEYDGPYHFHKLFENDGHELLVEHDQIKNKFCKNKSIQLLRIKYTEFDRAWLTTYRFIKDGTTRAI